MKKSMIIAVLAIIASMATAQTNEGWQTDRLEASSMLKYRKGAAYIIDCIETFRYEGNLEAKEWLTEAHAHGSSNHAGERGAPGTIPVLSMIICSWFCLLTKALLPSPMM